MIGSLDDNLLDKLTSSVTDTTVKSAIDNAFPKVKAILEQERNRLVDALMTGIPFASASAIAATLTYYYAQTVTQRALGYSLAAAIAGGGGLSVLLGLKSSDAPAVQAQGQSSPSQLDPIIEAASQKLVAQADPKVRAIIQEERTRLTNSLQTGLPWAIGSALAAVATAFVIPDNHEALKILGWLIAIALSAFGSWMALSAMQQKPV